MSDENDNTTSENTEGETQTNAEEATEQTEKVNWEAEAAKWKALSRKNEERAKANAEAQTELERIRNESLPEAEKAVEAAKAEGRKQALIEVAERLVDAEFRVAAQGRNINVASLVEGIDRSRFISEDGEVDAEKVKAFIDGLSPKQKADLGQGNRGTPAKKSTADLFAESTDF